MASSTQTPNSQSWPRNQAITCPRQRGYSWRSKAKHQQSNPFGRGHVNSLSRDRPWNCENWRDNDGRSLSRPSSADSASSSLSFSSASSSSSSWSVRPSRPLIREADPDAVRQFPAWQALRFGTHGGRDERSPPSTERPIESVDEIVVGLLVDLPKGSYAWALAAPSYAGPWRPNVDRAKPWNHPAIVTRVDRDAKRVEVVGITSFCDSGKTFIGKWPNASAARRRYFPFASDINIWPERSRSINPDGRALMAFEGSVSPLNYGSYVNGDDRWCLDIAAIRPHRNGPNSVLQEASLEAIRCWADEKSHA